MPDVRTEVSKADRSKPDPNQPWRYVCPECGNQVHRKPAGYLYHCSSCGTGYEMDELKDKRNGN